MKRNHCYIPKVSRPLSGHVDFVHQYPFGISSASHIGIIYIAIESGDKALSTAYRTFLILLQIYLSVMVRLHSYHKF